MFIYHTFGHLVEACPQLLDVLPVPLSIRTQLPRYHIMKCVPKVFPAAVLSSPEKVAPVIVVCSVDDTDDSSTAVLDLALPPSDDFLGLV